METLILTNPSDFLYLPINPVSNPSRNTLTKGDIAVKREIVDLKMQELSYNQIVEHFAAHHGVRITKHDISSVLLEAGARAKQLNGIYDSMVRDRFKVIEIDEQFQGSSTCYLGIVDKGSQYVYKFSRMAERDRYSFVKELEGLLDVMNSLDVIITDGHATYKTLIPELFDGVVHLLCHVHSYRIFLKEANMYHKQATDALKLLKKAENELDDAKHELLLKRRQLRRFRERVERFEVEYDMYRSMHGIKKWSKKSPWTPERREIKRRLNSARARLRGKKKTVDNKEQKVHEVMVKIKDLKATYMEKKQVSLQVGRLLSWFRGFLSCEQDDFDAERARLVTLLDRSSCPMAGRMLKFIHDNPQLQPATNVDLDELCKGFNASTNMVESFFGIARPLLDKARRFSDSPQSEALLEIFRLSINLSRPFTGPNKHTTPLERAGVHSKYEHYLDALFPLAQPASEPSRVYNPVWSSLEGGDPRRGQGFQARESSPLATGEIWLICPVIASKILEKKGG